MTSVAILFWGLVFVTAIVSFRFGSMIGLIFFVAVLMTGAVAVSHLTKSEPVAAALSHGLIRPGDANGIPFNLH